MNRTNGSGNPVHPVDIYVGNRIRARRKAAGETLQTVATKLGVAYQQVQKYETGMNRISASRLYEIAQALGTTPAAFFEGMEEGQARA